MNVTKLLLATVITLVLGLTACSNDDEILSSDGEGKNNTNVSVTLKMSQSSRTKTTKSSSEDYNKIGEWAGKDKIKTVAIYLVDGATVSVSHFTVGTSSSDDYREDIDEQTKEVLLKPQKAINTTAGIKKVYVLINGTPEVINVLSSTAANDFETAYKTKALALANSGASKFTGTSADKLAKKNDTINPINETIVMTNIAEVTINVAPNVTSTQALQKDNPLNNVSVSVERMVARVMVTTEAEEYDIKLGSEKLGVISDINWVLAQGESSLYIQRKANWITPNYGWIPTSESEFTGTEITGDNSKYDYSGLFENYNYDTQFGGTKVATMKDYAKNNATDTVIAELENSLAGKFILPNTHAYGAQSASSYKKGNTAYVLIRAKFTPEVFADGGIYNKGNDFFVGANGKFYISADNAVNPNKGGITGQTVTKYVKGKVLYYAWVNPDVMTYWYNSPVIRNNIYHIHITGFKNLGTNWNPLFPEDPNNPKGSADPDNQGKKLPLNPDPKPSIPGFKEPENPIRSIDPLTTPETWMSVDVKILPWTLHSYKVELGI